MKRLILILCVLLVSFGLSAQKITVLHEGDGLYENEKWATKYGRAAQVIEERYPGVKVEIINAAGGIQGGLNVTLESLIATGQTPNVVSLTIMRASRFFKPGQALDLKLYVPNELKKWEPMWLARTTKDGKVYGVPGCVPALGLTINLDLAAEVGWKAPEPASEWTMDQFMEFCKLIKAKTTGKYGTVLFSGSNPIPYVTCWWASFGVEFFKNGDYSKLAIDSPQTRKALAWMREMIDKGYTPPNATEIIDDDSVDMSVKGNIGANLWAPAPPANWAWYPFPSVAGAKNGGVFSNYEVAVAIDKKDKRLNQIGAELAVLCVDEFFQKYSADHGGVPSSMKGIVVPKLTIGKGDQQAAVIKKFGIFDMGAETAKYSAFRPVIRPFLSRFFTGEIDADTFIKEYTEAANEALR